MKKPSELAAEMQALQEAIDTLNADWAHDIEVYNRRRQELFIKGRDLGFSPRHMQGWLAKVPKQEPPNDVIVTETNGVVVAETRDGSVKQLLTPVPLSAMEKLVELDLTLPASLKR